MFAAGYAGCTAGRHKRRPKNYITLALLARLFAAPAGSDDVEVTGPSSIDASVEAVGIDFVGTRFLVFFTDVMAYAGSDPDFVRQTAAVWNNGFVPAAGSRLVKFVRSEADADSMFDPRAWPLPEPQTIWQFMEALAIAVEGHALAYPDVSHYFYAPQNGKLDSLHNRMSRRFGRDEYGVVFQCVTRPASDEGGFYGFERVEQAAPESGSDAEARPRRDTPIASIGRARSDRGLGSAQ